MDTWEYLSPEQDYTRDTIPTDYVWERLRYRRDSLLAQSDFRMIPDAPWDREPWEAYRQALRDLPANTVDPRTAVWPVAPSE
jgi:FMN phosphatase YigB (HAD superfamily)